MTTRAQERHYENMLKLYGRQAASQDPKAAEYGRVKVTEYSRRLSHVRALRVRLGVAA